MLKMIVRLLAFFFFRSNLITVTLKNGQIGAVSPLNYFHFTIRNISNNHLNSLLLPDSLAF
jgi:hypothetical protein